jgi:hypothetical protein
MALPGHCCRWSIDKVRHMKITSFAPFSIAMLGVLVAATVADEDPSANLLVRQIVPSDTDSRIDKFSGDGWQHWVYRNGVVAEKHQLLVFLPGTGGKGGNAKAFCRTAANHGFHVVSLAYPSSVSMSVFHDSPDPDAFLKARECIIYGKVPFGKLGINEANSIHNRLAKLLAHLDKTYAQEGWRQYLNKNGAPAWQKLVLSGGSQGGGHAALLAMQHEVARVLMFGSPKDFNIHFHQPAKWFSGPTATPLNRFFSFVHSADEGHGCTYPQQLENYRALKLSPRYPVIDVAQEAPPFRHTRLLTSTRSEEAPHPSVVQNPAYREVWTYLLEEPVE